MVRVINGALSEEVSKFNEDIDLFKEILEGWFQKPVNLEFQTKNKDMNPAFWEKTDEGYKCTVRTVGIKPSDVVVKIEDDCIHVEGKSTLDDYNYSQSMDLPLVEDVRDNLKDIKYKTQDGITIIYLNANRPKKKEIKVEKID